MNKSKKFMEWLAKILFNGEPKLDESNAKVRYSMQLQAEKERLVKDKKD